MHLKFTIIEETKKKGKIQQQQQQQPPQQKLNRFSGLFDYYYVLAFHVL